MKKLIMLLMFMYFFCGITAIATAQSTVVTATTFVAKSQILVPENMEVDMYQVKGTRATIEAHIEANCSEKVLKALLHSGYFAIKVVCDGEDTLKISMPNITGNKFVNGIQLEVTVKLVILVPEETTYLASK